MEHFYFTYGMVEPEFLQYSDSEETFEIGLSSKTKIIYVGGKFIFLTCGYRYFEHWDVFERIIKKLIKNKTKKGCIEWHRTFRDSNRVGQRRLMELYASGAKTRSYHMVYGQVYSCGMSSLIDMIDAVIYSESIDEEYLKAKEYIQNTIGIENMVYELDALYWANKHNLPKGKNLIGFAFDEVIKSIQNHINS